MAFCVFALGVREYDQLATNVFVRMGGVEKLREWRLLYDCSVDGAIEEAVAGCDAVEGCLHSPTGVILPNSTPCRFKMSSVGSIEDKSSYPCLELICGEEPRAFTIPIAAKGGCRSRQLSQTSLFSLIDQY